MKRANLLLSMIVFYNLWICYILYLFYDLSNYVYFWCLSLSLALIIIIQITQISENKYAFPIFVEEIFLYIGLLMISVAYAGLDNIFGLDTWLEFIPIKNLVLTGHWYYSIDYIPNRELANTFLYPSVHILIGTIHMISGVDLLTVVQWGGVLINGLILFPYFLISRTLFKSNKVALLSSVGFVFTTSYIMGANSGRQDLAMLYFWTVLYIFFKIGNYYTLNYRLSLLVIIVTTSLIFSHHLTRVILIIFFLSFLIYYKIYSIKFYKAKQIDKKFNQLLIFLLLFLIIGIWSYLVYIKEIPVISSIKLLIFTIFGKLPEHNRPIISPIVPLHSIVYFYGLPVLGLIYAILVFRDKQIRSEIITTFFIMFAGLLHILSYILQTFNVAFDFSRAVLFSFPLALIAISRVIIRNNVKYNIVKKILMINLIFSYIIISIFGYFPFMYDKSLQPNYSGNEFIRYIPVEILTGVKGLKTEGSIVGDHYIYLSYLVYHNTPIHLDEKYFTEGFLRNPHRYDWFYFNKIDKERIFIRKLHYTYPFQKVTEDLYLKYKISLHFMEVYNNGYLEIYKVK